MEIDIILLEQTPDSTLSQVRIDGKFFCFALEDGFREPKVHGETRIPHGRYPVIKRTVGKFFALYARKFRHEFALELKGVANFLYILLHIGNTVMDTDGCVLVGYQAGHDGHNFTLKQSTEAYVDLYRKIALAFSRGEEVWCNVIRESITEKRLQN